MASLITEPILVLDLDVMLRRPRDGSKKAQRPWARFTEPAKAKLCIADGIAWHCLGMKASTNVVAACCSEPNADKHFFLPNIREQG